MGISVVIPAYNEEKRIGDTLKSISNYFKKNFEIIVVDDCSKDNTSKIAKKFSKVKLIRNKINRGKGYCIKYGIENAKYDLVLITDSDLATPIEEFSKLKDEIDKGCDITIASRSLKKSKIVKKQPFLRRNVGKIFPFLRKIIVGLPFKDTQCGFKLFKRDKAMELVIKQTIWRFAFDVELLYVAKKKRFKVAEVPVTWMDAEGSTVSILRDGPKMMLDLFKIRFNDLRGKYK